MFEEPRSVDWQSDSGHGLQAWETSDANGPTGIVSVLAAAEELARCQTLDQILRRAVEVARGDIGLERVALYLQDESGTSLRGSWGTGADGAFTDERGLQRDLGETEREAHRRAEAGVGRWLQLFNAPLVATREGKTEVIGQGWLVLTPIRSLRAPIGMLYNDAAISKGPFDHTKQVRAAVFASLLGNLIEAASAPVARSRPLSPSGAKYGALVRQAIAALNEDPTASADALATKLSVSSARLARAFRAELGVSVVEYRNRLRLERFFGLVQQGGGNLSEAASAAGFGSYAQFHRIFRQHVGVTPRDYLAGPRAAV